MGHPPLENSSRIFRFEQFYSLETGPKSIWIGAVRAAVKKALIIDRTNNNRLNDIVRKCKANSISCARTKDADDVFNRHETMITVAIRRFHQLLGTGRPSS